MTRTRSLALAVAAAAVVIGLSACQPPEAGAAAIVGDTRISESSVSTAASDAVAAVESLPADSRPTLDQTTLLRTNVSRMVAHELLEIAAAEEGVTVSQTEIDAILTQAKSGSSQAAFEADIATQAGVPPSAIESFARDYLLRQKLGEKLAPTGDLNAQSAAATAKLGQVATEVGVTISPRYGVWDPTKGTLTTTGTDDLSRPAESPSPTPSGQ